MLGVNDVDHDWFDLRGIRRSAGGATRAHSSERLRVLRVLPSVRSPGDDLHVAGLHPVRDSNLKGNVKYIEQAELNAEASTYGR